MRMARQTFSPEQLATIDIPTLIAIGDKDSVAGSAEGLARLIDGAEVLIIPNRDHMLATGDRHYKEAVLANVVSYEENVRSVLTKVALGEADAGIVYASDVAGMGADQVKQIAIPDSLNTVAAYPIAVLADSPQPRWAQAFVDALLADAGQQVLADFGLMGREE